MEQRLESNAKVYCNYTANTRMYRNIHLGCRIHNSLTVPKMGTIVPLMETRMPDRLPVQGGINMNEGDMSRIVRKCSTIMEELLDKIPEDELYRRPLAIEMIHHTCIILKNLETDLLSIHRKYRDTFPYNGEELQEIKDRCRKLWEAII